MSFESSLLSSFSFHIWPNIGNAVEMQTYPKIGPVADYKKIKLGKSRNSDCIVVVGNAGGGLWGLTWNCNDMLRTCGTLWAG